jgi:predicted phosphodiesterase
VPVKREKWKMGRKQQTNPGHGFGRKGLGFLFEGLVGIMADSHGRPETIEAAVWLMKKHGCRTLIHLGDICDSNRPDTARTCMTLLKKNSVVAIKGNNDHIISMHQQRHQHGDQQRKEKASALSYLDDYKDLPLWIESSHVLFAHSLPFQELGLSCMTGVMNKNQSRRFFTRYPEHILFRGHSHQPGIIHQKNNRIADLPMESKQSVSLSPLIPCIVTCGALTRGFCLTWNPATMDVTCCSV